VTAHGQLTRSRAQSGLMLSNGPDYGLMLSIARCLMCFPARLGLLLAVLARAL
jgi:hypothetical protein